MVDTWSYSAIWSTPLTNVKWHSDPWPIVTSQPIRLSTNFMTLIPNLTFADYEWFPWSICNGCGMPAGNTYPSGHLVPSHHCGTCLCSNCWDQITRTCHVFTRLFISNTPWYFLDFDINNIKADLNQKILDKHWGDPSAPGCSQSVEVVNSTFQNIYKQSTKPTRKTVSTSTSSFLAHRLVYSWHASMTLPKYWYLKNDQVPCIWEVVIHKNSLFAKFRPRGLLMEQNENDNNDNLCKIHVGLYTASALLFSFAQ